MVDPIMTRTRLPSTQTSYFHVVFVSGSRIVSKIANPTLNPLNLSIAIYHNILENTLVCYSQENLRL
jgi:hypothetical protein